MAQKIGRGLGAIQEAANSSTNLLKIDPGKSKVVRMATPPDEIISVWEHTEQFDGQWKTFTCLGKADCPLCKAGKKASFKSYIAVIDREDDKVKLFKASKKVGVQILGLVEEYGDITARDFKISRQGEKLDTAYQFFPRDPAPCDFSKYEIPEYDELVALKPAAEILAAMQGGTTEGATEAPASGNTDGNKGGDENGDEYPF